MSEDFTLPSAAPFEFRAPRGKLALVMIDWQRDFLEEGGFGHALGNDVTPLREALAPASAVLRAARNAGMPVVHTLEAHASDLSDCPAAKLRRCSAIGQTLEGQAARGRLLVIGEPGNAIVEEVAPLPGEHIVHKPGKGAFFQTDLHAHLQSLGVTALLFTGVTTEVCVQTSMREANDRGYDSLVVSDATESYFAHFKAATLEMIVAQGGIVGWAAPSADVVAALASYAHAHVATHEPTSPSASTVMARWARSPSGATASKAAAAVATATAATATALACARLRPTGALSVAAAFGAGWLLREAWLRGAARREAAAMMALADREAAVSARLADGNATDGDVQIQCTRGDGRLFGVSRADTALVLIDMQSDFLHPKGRLGQHYDAQRHASLAKTVAHVEALLAAARRAGLTIAHSRSHRYGARVLRELLDGPQPGAPLVDAGGAGATAQHFGAVDEGYELLPALRALPGEIVVDKWTFGAFASTDLEAQLRARGVRKIVLAGILTNVCVFATAVQACDRLFRVCVVEDATGAFKPDWHDKAIDLLSGPQTAPGHAGKAVGLYFGEVSTLAHVQHALGKLAAASS